MKGGADLLVNVNKTSPPRRSYSLGTITPWCLIPQKGTAALASWKGQISNAEQLALHYSLHSLEVHEREVTNSNTCISRHEWQGHCFLTPTAFSIILQLSLAELNALLQKMLFLIEDDWNQIS